MTRLKIKHVRWVIAAGIVEFLFIFFAPLVPFTKTVTCGPPGGGIVFGCPNIPTGGAYHGYNSIGYSLSGWGAYSSAWLGGYSPPIFNGPNSGTLTAFGALLFVIVPIVCSLIVLLSPEIVEGTHLTTVYISGRTNQKN